MYTHTYHTHVCNVCVCIYMYIFAHIRMFTKMMFIMKGDRKLRVQYYEILKVYVNHYVSIQNNVDQYVWI